MIDSRIFGLVLALFSLAPAPPSQSPAATPYRYIRVGNAADATATPRAGYALMGGGSDLDEAFRWLCGRAGGGDFLVLRATGGDDYNPYVQGLWKLNSVATLIVPTRDAANDAFVVRTIDHASAVFIAGGDQANYINFWMGTAMHKALNNAIDRGVPFGGTSAGLAVMGEWAYTAQGDKPNDPNLDSKTALANPYGPRVTLKGHFLEIPILKGVIADTHFAKRDRMGRLLVFLARLNEPDGKPVQPTVPKIRGLGVEQGAAVLVEPSGQATIAGKGSAYFVETDGFAQVLQPGRPLTFRSFVVQKVEPGHAFDLKSWQGDAVRYTLSVEAGTIHSSQPGGAIY